MTPIYSSVLPEGMDPPQPGSCCCKATQPRLGARLELGAALWQGPGRAV